MRELKTSAAEMVAAARARIEEIETSDAIAMMEDPSVAIVDLRDVRERQKSGYIPGSVHCPRGMVEFWVDPKSPYFKEIFGQDKRFVFHCASGWRSALTVATLADMGFEASHLKNGFSSWVKENGPVAFPEETWRLAREPRESPCRKVEDRPRRIRSKVSPGSAPGFRAATGRETP